MSSQSKPSSSSSSRASPEPPSEVYLAQLHEHFTSSRLYTLDGKDEDEPLPPSLFPPNAHWTSREKDLFFHELAIHSRLRPDLIAQGIKTKTLMDVCVYLDMLEEGVENLEDIKEHEGLTRSTRKVEEYIRDDLPIAMEMTEQWCHFETQQASLIAASDAKFHDLWLAQQREVEVEAKRREVRAPHKGARDANNKRDRRGEKTRGRVVKEWLKEKEEEWKVEERLEKLGGDDLRALDMIVRGSEEQLLLKNPEEGGATNNCISPDAQESEILPPVPESGPSQSHPVFASQNSTRSSATPSKERLAHQNNSGDNSSTGQGTTDDTPPPEYILTLSPNSRRRLQKRMYMRRKRAQASGTAMETNPGRLKPGRKTSTSAKGKQKEDQLPVEELEGQQVPTDLTPSSLPQTTRDGVASTDVKKRSRHPHPSGKTKPYKTRTELEGIGLTQEALQEEGLDIFRFKVFHRLMRTYQTLHGDQDETDPQISFTLLQTLRASVVMFVYEVVKRALMVSEQDMRGKSHSRVWRKNENKYVNQRDVETAVELIGAEGLDRKKHFETLLQRLASDPGGDEEEKDADDPGSSERDRPGQTENSDSDEESWLGDGEESEGEDEGGAANLGKKLFSPPKGSPSPSTRSGSSSVSGCSLVQDREEELTRKCALVELLSPHRRIFPPFVRLPRSYAQEDESTGGPGKDKHDPLNAPRTMRMSTRGNTGGIPAPPSSSRTSAPSRQASPSGSSYADSSQPSSESSDIPSESEEEDDHWLASEDNLDSKDMEQETEYEKSLWAMFAADGIIVNQDPVPNAERSELSARTKRKRVDDGDDKGGESQVEQPKLVQTDDVGTSSQRKRPRRRGKDAEDVEMPAGQDDAVNKVVNRFRYAPPGTGRIKSTVYISDSESDSE